MLQLCACGHVADGTKTLTHPAAEIRNGGSYDANAWKFAELEWVKGFPGHISRFFYVCRKRDIRGLVV